MRHFPSLRLFVIISIITLTVTSCSENSSITPKAPIAAKTTADYSIFSVMDYQLSAEEKLLHVIFYESQRIYTVPFSASGFQTTVDLISKSKSEHIPIRVTMSRGIEIQQVLPASAAETEVFNQRFSEVETEREDYEEIIASMEELNQIFSFIQEQNCADGNAIFNICIPFQFVIDGCYARAHKMKQILEQHFGYTCHKIFSFSKTFHPLAVDAGDCCVFWGWHDAPLVKVNTPAGVLTRVIDPSLFDHPVSIKEWLEIQENESCDSKAGVGNYEIVPGSWYLSDGTKDPYYISTNLICVFYKNLQTCP